MTRFFFALLLIPTLTFSQEGKPRVIIGLVVDQMRYELYQRLSSEVGTRGFGRLNDEGVSLDSLFYPFVPTYTGPDHASIFTGVPPSIHGIVGNSWLDLKNDQKVNCVGDSDSNKGPHLLLSPTIGDRLKEQGYVDQVIGISIKDRSAILPAGNRGDLAIWMDDEGNFISNDHYPYYSQYAPILKEFDAPSRIREYMQGEWKPLKPSQIYIEHCSEDNVPWEKSIVKGYAPAFPYDLEILFQQKKEKGIRYTPGGNTLLFDLAYYLIPEMIKGSESTFLSLSLSASDYIGHSYGPMSWEVFDTYLRLNEELDQFILFLDSLVGRDEYILFLTSDHGAADPPGYSRSIGRKAENIPYTQVRMDLEKALKTPIPFKYYDLNLYVEWDKIKDLDTATVIGELVTAAQGLPYVEKAWSPLIKDESQTNIIQYLEKGYYPGRSGDVKLYLKEYFIEYGKRGTTHGSANPYDSHVPGWLLGGDIPSGSHLTDPIPITLLTPILLDHWGLSITDWSKDQVKAVKNLEKSIRKR